MYPYSISDYLNLSIRTGIMMSQAQMVVGLRMLGFMGLLNIRPSETHRMMREKVHAGVESAVAASQAAMSGAHPAAVAEAALAPVARRTRSNVSRLTRGVPAKAGSKSRK